MKYTMLVLVLLCASLPIAAYSSDGSNQSPSTSTSDTTPMGKVAKVESRMVCMVNNRAFTEGQIPVAVGGKTYYGCCKMCKQRLTKDRSQRFAVDPVSKKKIDKAKAVIGASIDKRVLYFENEANLEKYNASFGK